MQPTFMEYFAKEGFSSYSISMRGQAGSGIAEGAKNGGTLVRHALDLAELIEREIKEPVVLVGHSFGGLIVQRYMPIISSLTSVTILGALCINAQSIRWQADTPLWLSCEERQANVETFRMITARVQIWSST